MRTDTPTIPTDPLPPILAQYTRRFVLRSRQLEMLYAGGAAVAFLVTWTLAWALVDRLLPLPTLLRVMLLLLQIAAVILLLARPLRRFLEHEVPWHCAAAEIERRDPAFAGGLQTSFSQLLMPSQHRGSAALVAQLVDDAAARAGSSDVAALPPARESLRPSVIAAVAFALCLLLFTFSWLDLPRLLKRELFPWTGALPVTTTRLTVLPGTVSIIQGDPLTVTVHAERLGDAQPVLNWQGDDPLISSAVMLPNADGFTYTFASIDRPMHYSVSGGDASTPRFDVTVTPRPAVSSFRVHYTYPDWTELQPLDVNSSNGQLEGPAGTSAAVSVVASEPLNAAKYFVDGAPIETTSTVDPSVRQATVQLFHSGPWKVELNSARGIRGDGPSTLSIHAIPAEQPDIRLILPGDENELRLHPRDLLTLKYEAADKFALRKLTALIGVNSKQPLAIPIPVGNNHRTQAGSFDVDLAELQVNLGDVIAITVRAENKAGLRATSQVCRVIVSPRSVDLNASQRLAELEEAARLANVLVTETAAASKALEQSPAGDAKTERDEQVAPHLAAADAAAGELGRALLASISHSDDPQLAIALAALNDLNQQSASTLESADAVLMTDPKDKLRDRLNRAANPGQQLKQALDALWPGERAVQLGAQHEDNIAAQQRLATATGSLADTLRRSIQRSNDEQAVSCKVMGLDPNESDLSSQLSQRIQQAGEMARRFGPVDYGAAADDWSHSSDNTPLMARMIVGSQSEMVRPQGDFVWARDLDLAARAAHRIDDDAATNDPSRSAYPQAIRAVQHLHEMKQAHPAPPMDQLVSATKDADAAREKLRHWAGDDEATSQPVAVDSDRAALEAAAAEAEAKAEQTMRLEHPSNSANSANPQDSASADHQPDPSADQTPAPTTAEIEQQRQAEQSAQDLEKLAKEQRHLRTDTQKSNDAKAGDLAKRQAELTAAIQKTRDESRSPMQSDPDQAGDHSGDKTDKPPDAPADAHPEDTRESAMSAIRSAQERLQEMPKQITAAREAADAQHKAADAAKQAQQDADNAQPDQKEAAQHKADQAKQAADTAKAAADEAAKSASADSAGELADSLKQYAPEAEPAVEAMKQQLAPSLAAMSQADSAGDKAAADHSAGDAKHAVAETQRRLNDALQSLLMGDPLTTAKWFSNEAAKMLEGPTPQRAAAIKLQKGAVAALELAWDNALHRAAAQRLGHIAMESSILRLYPGGAGIGTHVAGVAEPAPAARNWGHLRARDKEELSAPTHENDPAEYQDALRVYFHALSQEKDAGGK